jgi:3-oxoacyl-(acyl-carrier-protein) synthase
MSPLSADRRETWITGIGLVSSLGDGLEANWDALRGGRVNIDLEKYAPWMIHPLAPLNLDNQIPKKGDQRQMEAWQRIGTYAAGLALDSAGIKHDKGFARRSRNVKAAARSDAASKIRRHNRRCGRRSLSSLACGQSRYRTCARRRRRLSCPLKFRWS